MKVPFAPGKLTLGDFKRIASLQKSDYKFYFKSHDPEFGTVKEELIEDGAVLPAEGDKVVVWVISSDNVEATLFEPAASSSSPDYIQSHASRATSENRIKNNDNTICGTMRSNTRVTVNLLLDDFVPLGLSIVRSEDEAASKGIFIEQVLPDSIAERDGRIKANDRIIEVNGVDLQATKASEAISIFKQFVNMRGAINLVLQRRVHNTSLLNYDTPPPLPLKMPKPPYITPRISSAVGFNPATDLPAPIITNDSQQLNRNFTPEPQSLYEENRGTYSLPRSLTPHSLYTTSNFDRLTSNSDDLRLHMDSRSDYEPSSTNTIRQIDIALHCGKDSIHTIYSALRADSKSLDIKDREWLKVPVKDAFIGSTLVKWLSRNVYGFCNRSEIKRYANQMLSLGLLKGLMPNEPFSERCYYTLT